MTCLNESEEAGYGGLSNRLWQISTGVLTINLNGWFSKVKRGEEVRPGVLRYQALFGVIQRHNLSMVGVQEHHWGSLSKAEEARRWLGRKGWAMRETCGVGREGVALLWKGSEWSEVSSMSIHPRLLIVQMKHVSGDTLWVLVGHMHCEPGMRKKQWEQLDECCRRHQMALDISLCDHNSVLHAGATSRWNVHMTVNEQHAIGTEDSVLHHWQLVDAWDEVHGEDVTMPGYTHSYHRGEVVIERRIDRIMVKQDITPFVTSMYTLPVGFSDHLGVVCLFRDMGDDFEGERRWKFNLQMLKDPFVVESLRMELSRLQMSSFEGWEEGIAVLRRQSLRFSASQREKSPIHREICELVRMSHKGYVPRRAWQLFERMGVQATTMEQAYASLLRLLLVQEGELQRQLALSALRDALQTHDSLMRAKRQRDKAVWRMLQELQTKRSIFCVRNQAGFMVRGGIPVAQALKDFWKSITPTNLPSKETCAKWLERLSLPNRWKSLMPALLRPRTKEVLCESLQRMDGSSSPGEDGIWAACYQAFPEFFSQRLEEVFLDLEKGASLPNDWTVACIRPIPKKPGALKPEDQRPIALQQCKTKWLMMTILVQTEDVFAQIIPLQQKAYLKGRRMEDHLISVMSHWEHPRGQQGAEAWIAIDYSKAYDSVNHGLVEALLEFIQMPVFLVRICLAVMRGAILFLVGRRLVREVEMHPESGIRQGDPFSPVVFVLVASLLLFVSPRQDCTFWLYSDDTLVRVVGSPHNLKVKSQAILNSVQLFGMWSGLRINMVKSEVLLKGVPRENTWVGLCTVPFIKYLGGYIGDIPAERSFAPAMIKVWSRCCWLSGAPLSLEEKKHLIHSWVLPCLRIPALLRLAPKSVCSRLNAAVRLALNVKPWRMSMEILTLPAEKGGVGLVKPEVFLDWTTAQTFWKWLRKDTILTSEINERFMQWVKKRGMSLEKPFLPLLVLAGAPRIQVPWIVHCLRAWSRLMARLPGVSLPKETLPNIPLWHNKLFSVGGTTRASNALIAQGKTTVSQVISFSAGAPDVTLPMEWLKPWVMTSADYVQYQVLMKRVQMAWRQGLGIQRKGARFEDAAMNNPYVLSLCVAQGSKQEERQPGNVWSALHKLHLPGPDKDFIRQALWKKLAVGSRLHVIFPAIVSLCPLDGLVEDHHHVLKACQFLQVPLSILRQCLSPVYHEGSLVEFSRLCYEYPLLSLSCSQGLLVWKVLRTLWVFRCAVMFRGQHSHVIPFMASLLEALQWWMKQEALAVPNGMVRHFLRGVEAWLSQTAPLPVSLPLQSEPLVRWRKKKCSRAPMEREIPQRHFPSSLLEGESLLEKTVFTDGSFAWESPGVGFAGCGYYVEGEPPISKALPLPGERQTNNRAELFAVITAVRDLPQEWCLLILSDSKYVVQGVKERFPHMGQRGNVQPRPVGTSEINADLWRDLVYVLAQRHHPWSLMWLRGHVGVPGNEKADRLANQARLQHPSRVAWLQRSQASVQWFEWDTPESAAPTSTNIVHSGMD